LKARVLALSLALSCVTAVTACNREPLDGGDACTRSSECDEGLVCVEGECGTDLAAIASPGTVPMLMQGEEMPPPDSGDAAMMMPPQGGSDAATPTPADPTPADAAVADSGP